jgi:hypothetical protein
MVNYAAAADDVQTRPSPERFGGTVSVFGWEIAVNGVTAVREIYIRLGRNDELKNWSVEINGQFHEHVMDEGFNRSSGRCFDRRCEIFDSGAGAPWKPRTC